MRTFSFSALTILTAAALSSCSNPPASSAFVGSYSGTFKIAVGSSDSGDLNLAVASDGTLSGTITLTSNVNKPQAAVTGSILSDGTTNATYKYAGTFPTVTLKGKLSISDKKVTGLLNISAADVADGGQAIINLTQK